MHPEVDGGRVAYANIAGQSIVLVIVLVLVLVLDSVCHSSTSTRTTTRTIRGIDRQLVDARDRAAQPTPDLSGRHDAVEAGAGDRGGGVGEVEARVGGGEVGQVSPPGQRNRQFGRCLQAVVEIRRHVDRQGEAVGFPGEPGSPIRARVTSGSHKSSFAWPGCEAVAILNAVQH